MSSDTQVLDATKIQTQRSHDGALWTVTLDSPKGNVLDATMTGELTRVFVAAADDQNLKAVLLTATGSHFCFGASVEEHQRDQVAAMLDGFHTLFRTILASSVPVVAAVRGSCLGGGLELAAFCQRVVAHPDARFGQPEVKLGVFAPVASVVLNERIGRGAADDLLLSGRLVGAAEARDLRLIEEVADEPEAAAQSWIEEQLLTHSASSLRYATQAARVGFAWRFDQEIEALESLYLGGLMATHDANEGIAAFLEKRRPEWTNA